MEIAKVVLVLLYIAQPGCNIQESISGAPIFFNSIGFEKRGSIRFIGSEVRVIRTIPIPNYFRMIGAIDKAVQNLNRHVCTDAHDLAIKLNTTFDLRMLEKPALAKQGAEMCVTAGGQLPSARTQREKDALDDLFQQHPTTRAFPLNLFISDGNHRYADNMESFGNTVQTDTTYIRNYYGGGQFKKYGYHWAMRNIPRFGEYDAYYTRDRKIAFLHPHDHYYGDPVRGIACDFAQSNLIETRVQIAQQVSIHCTSSVTRLTDLIRHANKTLRATLAPLQPFAEEHPDVKSRRKRQGVADLKGQSLESVNSITSALTRYLKRRDLETARRTNSTMAEDLKEFFGLLELHAKTAANYHGQRPPKDVFDAITYFQELLEVGKPTDIRKISKLLPEIMGIEIIDNDERRVSFIVRGILKPGIPQNRSNSSGQRPKRTALISAAWSLARFIATQYEFEAIHAQIDGLTVRTQELEKTTAMIIVGQEKADRQITALTNVIKAHVELTNATLLIDETAAQISDCLRQLEDSMRETRSIVAAVVEKRTTSDLIHPIFLKKLENSLIRQLRGSTFVQNYNQMETALIDIGNNSIISETRIPLLEPIPWDIIKVHVMPDLKKNLTAVVEDNQFALNEDQTRYFILDDATYERCRNTACSKTAVIRQVSDNKCGPAQFAGRSAKDCEWIPFTKDHIAEKTDNGFIFVARSETKITLTCGHKAVAHDKIHALGFLRIPNGCQITIHWPGKTSVIEGPPGNIEVSDPGMTDIGSLKQAIDESQIAAFTTSSTIDILRRQLEEYKQIAIDQADLIKQKRFNTIRNVTIIIAGVVGGVTIIILALQCGACQYFRRQNRRIRQHIESTILPMLQPDSDTTSTENSDAGAEPGSGGFINALEMNPIGESNQNRARANIPQTSTDLFNTSSSEPARNTQAQRNILRGPSRRSKRLSRARDENNDS